jgi:hypothetical protein
MQDEQNERLKILCRCAATEYHPQKLLELIIISNNTIESYNRAAERESRQGNHVSAMLYRNAAWVAENGNWLDQFKSKLTKLEGSNVA